MHVGQVSIVLPFFALFCEPSGWCTDPKSVPSLCGGIGNLFPSRVGWSGYL